MSDPSDLRRRLAARVERLDERFAELERMPVGPAAVRLAEELRAESAVIASLMEALSALVVAREGLQSSQNRPMMDAMQGQPDSRALKIAKTRTKGKRRPIVQAIYDAGLTPNDAAAICKTTRDVLKQAWAKGDQFREAKPEWKLALSRHGVPLDLWPTRG